MPVPNTLLELNFEVNPIEPDRAAIDLESLYPRGFLDSSIDVSNDAPQCSDS